MTFATILDTAIRCTEVAFASTIVFGAIKHSFTYDARKRYSAISAQIDAVTTEARQLNSEMLGHAHVMALVAAAIIWVANCPAAEAQPLLPGFEPVGLLVAGNPSSQIQEPRADLSWCSEDFDYSVEDITEWEKIHDVAPQIECAPAPIGLWATDAKFADIRKACYAC